MQRRIEFGFGCLLPFFLIVSIMASLNFGSLNVNGCRGAEKRFALFDFLNWKKASVVFLQETHTDVDNQVQWLREWKGTAFLSHGSNVSAGVVQFFFLQIYKLKIVELKKSYLEECN